MKHKTSIIRDPVHGSIEISKAEMAIINHHAFQRLRNIKQTAFADYAFPGATHSRYSHSLGAMHVASKIFDCLFSESEIELEPAVKNKFRQTVRLAALLHDIGHAPFSHSMEVVMPQLSELKMPSSFSVNQDRQATHEDFTLKLIVDSDLSKHIENLFADYGIEPSLIASLSGYKEPSNQFKVAGIDFLPILQQIISSDCDADRMDYLQRDSLYCGVNYGKFDAEWLINNLIPVVKNNAVYLGVKAKAIFSFEDFLLSRYHMFASVYFHHTPVIFDYMLQKSYEDNHNGFVLPADLDAYLQFDDIEILYRLRRSECELAQRIVERKPYALLDQFTSESPERFLEVVDHGHLGTMLSDNGLKYMRTVSSGIFSKHLGHTKIPMYVREHSNQTFLLEEYTPLFKRYGAGAEIHRIFVEPESLFEAKRLMTMLMAKKYDKS